MKKITTHILTALTILLIVGIVEFVVCYNFLFGMYDNALDVIRWLWMPILAGIAVMYALAFYIGRLLPNTYRYKIYHGIVLVFMLFLAGILGGCMAFAIMGNNDMDSVADVLPVVLIFLLFGGLPTLAVGCYLGNRLAE